MGILWYLIFYALCVYIIIIQNPKNQNASDSKPMRNEINAQESNDAAVLSGIMLGLIEE